MLKTKSRLPGRINPFVISIFAFAAGISAYFFFFRQNEISLELKIPEEAVFAEAFSAEIKFTNDSGNSLKDVKIYFFVPAGLYFAEGEKTSRKTIDVGDMGDGEIYQDSFDLVALDASTKKIEVEVSYRPASLNKNLLLSKTAEVKIKSFLEAKIIVPEEVLAGEEFSWSLEYKNDSKNSVLAEMDLGKIAGFTTDFTKKGLEAGGNESGKLEFKGVLMLPDETVTDLKIKIKGKFMGGDYVIAEPTASIRIAPSPLSVKVEANGKSEFTAYPGDILNYRLTVKNNSDAAMESVILTASLKGVMGDFNTLKTDGFFNQASQTISWDYSRVPEFKSLSSGASKILDFSLAIKSDYPLKRINDKNFTLEVKTRVESPTVPRLVNSSKTIGLAESTIKVGGKAKIASQAFFRDAESGILNSGPFPPEAGRPTEFTAHWTLSNYATDLKNVEIRARIEAGVALTEKKSVEVGELSFDEDKNEVVWKIPSVLASSGVVTEPLQAIFQMRALPFSSQVGLYMPLLGETIVSAKDEFTGETLSAGSPSLTTELPFDKTVQPSQGIVR